MSDIKREMDERNEAVEASMRAWRESRERYGTLQLSERRWAVIRLYGVSTRGGGDDMASHGHYEFVEGGEKLTWSDAQDLVIELSREEQRPHFDA